MRIQNLTTDACILSAVHQCKGMFLKSMHLLAACTALVYLCGCSPAESVDTATYTIEKVFPDSDKWLMKPSNSETALEVKVSSANFAIYEAGETVEGHVESMASGTYLQRIWPANPMERGIMAQINRLFWQETQERGSNIYRDLDEPMPRFALWNQHGELARSQNWLGKYVVMNFVFTRCTQPNMCPLSTMKMRELQQLASEHGIDNLQLVSISIDPTYDTPGIMYDYLERSGVAQSNFAFLSGDERIMESLKAQIGVLSEKDDKLLVKHTLMTTVFDPAGKIFYRVPGSGWSPEAIIERIEAHIKDNAAP